MVHTYIVASELSATAPLDWIIGTGFLLVVGGVCVFRVLAIWRGWLSDDE
jgi:hypothetical protein